LGRYNTGLLKAWFVPGGVLLLIAALLLQSGALPISAQAIDFYYYAVCIVGILLAWRFHSSRAIFALLTLILAHRAIEFFSSGRILAAGPGHIAFEAVSLLLPINFIVFSVAAERGFAVPAVVPRLGLLFLEAVFVAVICRPGETISPWFVRLTLLDPNLFAWTRIPQPALLFFIVAGGLLLVRFLLYHKPVEHGLIWSLAAIFVGLQAGAVGQLGTAYFATAGLILVASLVENSYFLAYHDELTTLPSRRAFNDALLGLEPPYAIAVVDIDHFKKVNDNYGHDTGDQVLSMVATYLTRITSGAHAYRVGGEEFAILFPGKTVKEVMPALEDLRLAISTSSFRVRVTPERRKIARGPDRRHEEQGLRRKSKNRTSDFQPPEQLSVTVSIGAAEPTAKGQRVEQVIQSADKALYRAKRTGRNRVEIAKSANRALARGAASQ
jgi:diguanylate cyclase (GGDEF)-like protein